MTAVFKWHNHVCKNIALVVQPHPRFTQLKIPLGAPKILESSSIISSLGVFLTSATMAGGWTAANLAPSKRKRSREEVGEADVHGYDGGDGSDARGGGGVPSADERRGRRKGRRDRPRRARPAETSESALARLTSSYGRAMEAVGALHRADAAVAKAAEVAASSGRKRRGTADKAKAEVGAKTESEVNTWDEDGKTGFPSDLKLGTNGDGDKNDGAARGSDGFGEDDGHEADTEEDPVPVDPADQLSQVATAARSALCRGVLLDPLVEMYCPTLREELSGACGDGDGECDGALHLSAADRSSVRELAYLSLLNYADLLVAGCGCAPPNAGGRYARRILERGVVRTLRTLVGVNVPDAGSSENPRPSPERCLRRGRSRHRRCCWEWETEDRTLRLAAAAYCDATALDGTDPTLWLKTACAARALGRAVARGADRRRGGELGGRRFPDSNGVRVGDAAGGGESRRRRRRRRVHRDLLGPSWRAAVARGRGASLPDVQTARALRARVGRPLPSGWRAAEPGPDEGTP